MPTVLAITFKLELSARTSRLVRVFCFFGEHDFFGEDDGGKSLRLPAGEKNRIIFPTFFALYGLTMHKALPILPTRLGKEIGSQDLRRRTGLPTRSNSFAK